MPLEVSVRKYSDYGLNELPIASEDEIEVYQSFEVARVAEACGIQNMNDMSLKEIWIRIHHLYDYYATLMPNFHKYYKSMRSLKRMQDINFKTNVSRIDSKTFVMRMAAYATQDLVSSLQDADVDIDYNYVLNCKESDGWAIRAINNKIRPKVKLTSEQYEELICSHSFQEAFGYNEPPIHIGDMIVGDEQ
tara:strand:- start:1408 stop:1980 length:573 start_codon:yes stop_codon:yes gene_type:complete